MVCDVFLLRMRVPRRRWRAAVPEQGREQDVVLISTVRVQTPTQKPGGNRRRRGSETDGGTVGPAAAAAGSAAIDIGFLADTRRLNVALTRGRYGCYVVGSRATLAAADPTWAQLLARCIADGGLVTIDHPQRSPSDVNQLLRSRNRNSSMVKPC